MAAREVRDFAACCDPPAGMLGIDLAALASVGVGLFRVAGAGSSDPERAGIVVDGIPDPAGAGDLVLPLFQRCSADLDDPELPLERMLTLVDVTRVTGERYPRPIKVVRYGGQ